MVHVTKTYVKIQAGGRDTPLSHNKQVKLRNGYKIKF